MTDINDRLTALETIERILDSGCTIVARRHGTQTEIVAAKPIDKATTDKQPIREVAYEGLTLAFHGEIVDASGDSLGDALRDVAKKHDLS